MRWSLPLVTRLIGISRWPHGSLLRKDFDLTAFALFRCRAAKCLSDSRIGWQHAIHGPVLEQPWQTSLCCHYAKAAKQRKEDPAADSNSQVALGELRKTMEKTMQHLQRELAGIRTGRASAGMLDQLKVEVQGQRLPLRAVANVSVRDSRTLLVSPFDASTISVLEKALQTSALRVNPRVEDQELVVPITQPTAESLAAMQKLVSQSAESAKVSARAARQAGMKLAKGLGSKDDQRRAEKQVQKLLNDLTAEIDELATAKQQELKVL